MPLTCTIVVWSTVRYAIEFWRCLPTKSRATVNSRYKELHLISLESSTQKYVVDAWKQLSLIDGLPYMRLAEDVRFITPSKNPASMSKIP